MQKAAVEVGCTYTGEFELLLCSVNIATPLRIMRGLYADKTTLSIPEGTHFYGFFWVLVSPAVYLKILRKYITIFCGSFFSAWSSCEFFPVGEFPTSRDNEIHNEISPFSFMSCCTLVLTYF